MIRYWANRPSALRAAVSSGTGTSTRTTSALNRMSAGMSKRGAEPYRGLCLRCGRPENGVLSNGQLFEGLLKELRRRLEPTV